MDLRSPAEVISFAIDLADELKRIMNSQGLIHTYHFTSKGVTTTTYHPKAEAWEIALAMIGCTQAIESVVWSQEQNGYVATAVIIRNRDGMIIGRGTSICSRWETSWEKRDDYALAGMAQTRSKARAARQIIGFLIKLAGLEPTPAEEMGYVDAEFKKDDPKPAAQPTYHKMTQKELDDLQDRLINVGASLRLTPEDVQAIITDLWPKDLHTEDEKLYVSALRVAISQGRNPTIDEVIEDSKIPF
jgi:hypothetical protein